MKILAKFRGYLLSRLIFNLTCNKIAPLQSHFGVNTAENGPRHVCGILGAREASWGSFLFFPGDQGPAVAAAPVALDDVERPELPVG